MIDSGVKERFDLCAERLDVLHLQNLCANPRPWARVGLSQITDRSIVRRVVDHDVVARLKETHLANLFRADPRRSYVRDGAGGKFDSRVRGVNSIRENRDADGVHVGNLDVAPNQPRYSRSKVMDESEAIREKIQEALYEMLRERRSVWFG